MIGTQARGLAHLPEGGASPQRSRLHHSPHHQSTPPPLRQASRSPEVVAADAAAEVKRLENAIQVLGETNPHAKPLVEALRVARASSRNKSTSRRFQKARAAS